MSEKMFSIKIVACYCFSLKELWPDGNAPKNPTVKDVEELIERDGGVRTVISDWNFPVGVSVTEFKC